MGAQCCIGMGAALDQMEVLPDSASLKGWTSYLLIIGAS